MVHVLVHLIINRKYNVGQAVCEKFWIIMSAYATSLYAYVKNLIAPTIPQLFLPVIKQIPIANPNFNRVLSIRLCRSNRFIKDHKECLFNAFVLAHLDLFRSLIMLNVPVKWTMQEWCNYIETFD